MILAVVDQHDSVLQGIGLGEKSLFSHMGENAYIAPGVTVFYCYAAGKNDSHLAGFAAGMKDKVVFSVAFFMADS